MSLLHLLNYTNYESQINAWMKLSDTTLDLDAKELYLNTSWDTVDEALTWRMTER